MSGEIKELQKIMLDHEMCLSLLLSNINNCASHKLYFLSKIRNNIKPMLCIVNIQADLYWITRFLINLVLQVGQNRLNFFSK